MRLESVEWFGTPSLGAGRGTLVFEFDDERFAVEKRDSGWWLWKSSHPGLLLRGATERALLLCLSEQIGWEL